MGKPLSSTDDKISGPAAAEAGGNEFRSITHLGRRYAVRLEPIFWKVLQLAANHRRERFSEYVGKIVSTTPESQNRTSILRVHAVSWLSRRLLDTAAQGISQKTLESVSAASLLPVFSVGRDNKLTGHNPAFRQMLRDVSEQFASIAPSDEISVVFQRDVDALRTALSQSRDKFIEDCIIIKQGTRSLEKPVRIVALETASGQQVGLYVVVCAERVSAGS